MKRKLGTAAVALAIVAAIFFINRLDPQRVQDEFAAEQAALQAVEEAQRQAENQDRKRRVTEENREKGEAFLEENMAEEGVVVLASGLQYKVLKEGTGPKPRASDMVSVQYIGTLIDGTEFDSSKRRGAAVNFVLSEVIAGWQEAVALMPVGSTWKLFIPYDLGYGAQGQRPMVPPYATLIFEIELVEILD